MRVRGREDTWSARVALEGLRIGAVNRAVVRALTYGRDVELERLQGTVRENPGGSTQILIGGYGAGKSHLCECLALRLEAEGYAVARVELGASHGRAENPKAVLAEIERSLSVVVDGLRISGSLDLGILIRAIRLPRRYFRLEKEIIDSAHRRFPGRISLLDRFAWLRDEIPRIWGEDGRGSIPDLCPSDDIPTQMTAANLAVAAANRLAHDLAMVGVPGLVILLDEAERSEWAANAYRVERARTLMHGLALGAANRPTSDLHHFRNRSYPAFIPSPPSRIHTVFAFTWIWGMPRDLARMLDLAPIRVQPLPGTALEEIRDEVSRLYERAYGETPELSAGDWELVNRNAGAEDVRGYVRCLVAAFDTARLGYCRATGA